jgi:hypothetical protein
MKMPNEICLPNSVVQRNPLEYIIPQELPCRAATREHDENVAQTPCLQAGWKPALRISVLSTGINARREGRSLQDDIFAWSFLMPRPSRCRSSFF